MESRELKGRDLLIVLLAVLIGGPLIGFLVPIPGFEGWAVIISLVIALLLEDQEPLKSLGDSIRNHPYFTVYFLVILGFGGVQIFYSLEGRINVDLNTSLILYPIYIVLFVGPVFIVIIPREKNLLATGGFFIGYGVLTIINFLASDFNGANPLILGSISFLTGMLLFLYGFKLDYPSRRKTIEKWRISTRVPISRAPQVQSNSFQNELHRYRQLSEQLLKRTPQAQTPTPRTSTPADALSELLTPILQQAMEQVNPVLKVRLSYDAHYIVSRKQRGPIQIWDLNSQKLLHAVYPDGEEITDIAISPIDNEFAYSTKSGTITVIDMKTKGLVKTLKQDSSQLIAIAFSPTKKYLAAGLASHAIKVFEYSTGNLMKILKGHDPPMFESIVTADSPFLGLQAHLAWGMAFDGNCYLLEYFSGSLGPLAALSPTILEAQAQVRQGGIHPPSLVIAFTSEERFLVSGGADGNICVWDFDSSNLNLKIRSHIGPIKAISIPSDNQTIVSGSMDGTIRVWNIHSGEAREYIGASKIMRNYQQSNTVFAINAVKIDSSQNNVLSAGADMKIEIWNYHQPQMNWTLEGHSSSIESLDTKGNIVVSGELTGSIIVWDLETRTRKVTLKDE
ncbi:MAG: WD40 repeat domain-containing protein [Candidatus Thorarchaeota archaeon]